VDSAAGVLVNCVNNVDGPVGVVCEDEVELVLVKVVYGLAITTSPLDLVESIKELKPGPDIVSVGIGAELGVEKVVGEGVGVGVGCFELLSSVASSCPLLGVGAILSFGGRGFQWCSISPAFCCGQKHECSG
jgi:hypothetical protein